VKSVKGMRHLLVSYDVSTETSAGRRRLRKVAQICCAYGVRVQKSVFECTLTDGQVLYLISRLLDVIDEGEDSLRLYPIPAGDRGVKVFGVERHLSLDDLLLI
jgi:CRISPR-associated protein Cas2